MNLAVNARDAMPHGGGCASASPRSMLDERTARRSNGLTGRAAT